MIIACTSDTQNVLAMIQEFECKCTEYEQWLNDANKVLEDCGPIGADIDRLQVQEVILEVSRRIILFFVITMNTVIVYLSICTLKGMFLIYIRFFVKES